MDVAGRGRSWRRAGVVVREGMKDWTALAEALGPQPAAYHREAYNFPRPLTPEQMPRFPDAELELTNGKFVRMYPVNYGREEFRMRDYVKAGVESDG